MGIPETEVSADLRLNLCRNFGLEKRKDSCVVRRGHPSTGKSTDRSGLVNEVVGLIVTSALETIDAFRPLFPCWDSMTVDLEGPDCSDVTSSRMSFTCSAFRDAFSFYNLLDTKTLFSGLRKIKSLILCSLLHTLRWSPIRMPRVPGMGCAHCSTTHTKYP